MFEDTTFKRVAARRTGMQRSSTTESTPELSRLCTLRAGRSGAQITLIIAGLPLRSPFAHNRRHRSLRLRLKRRCHWKVDPFLAPDWIVHGHFGSFTAISAINFCRSAGIRGHEAEISI